MVFGRHSESGLGLPDLVWHDSGRIHAGHAGSVFGTDDHAAHSTRCRSGGVRCAEQSGIRGAGFVVDRCPGIRQSARTLGRMWSAGAYPDGTVNVVASRIVRAHATDHRRYGAPGLVCARRIFGAGVVQIAIAVVSRSSFDADAGWRKD